MFFAFHKGGFKIELRRNSLIKINEGALNGVNPSLSVLSSCISNPTDIIISGNGSIIDYSQDVYIQNQTISSNKYIGGKNIFVGNHVTTSQTAGDVLINNSANVIFDCKNIVFDPGFECAFGSTYEVKNHWNSFLIKFYLLPAHHAGVHS